MKNILNNLGGALGGALGNSGLADKLQSTLGSVTGGQGGQAGQAGASGGQSGQSQGGAAIPGLGNINLSNLNLGGMLGSAAVGGLLGALLGGKGAKKLAKGALVVGGTAAAGALAWNFYQKWSQSKVSAETVSVPGQQPQAPGQAAPTGWPTALETPQQAALPPAENTALLLLEAIIFAARADGHIDEEEKAHIQNAVAGLFPGQDMSALLDHLLSKPIDPNALAARVTNAEEGRDLYRLSCTVITVDSFMERSYLDGLAQALRIPEADKEALEREAAEAK